MPTLPAHPNLDQLRHQAKDLLRSAKTGDSDALAQSQAVSEQLTLASAQLAVARAYGFASWPKLKAEVETRTVDLVEKVDAFCTASIRDGSGRAAAVALMLDLGFPIESNGGDHGATALHVAAYSGSANTVRLLLDRGADIEAHDGNWNSTPLEWAAVGSGEKPQNDPAADWVETVRILVDAGASTDAITLAPDDPKPPSQEVAELLRTHIDRA